MSQKARQKAGQEHWQTTQRTTSQNSCQKTRQTRQKARQAWQKEGCLSKLKVANPDRRVYFPTYNTFSTPCKLELRKLCTTQHQDLRCFTTIASQTGKKIDDFEYQSWYTSGTMKLYFVTFVKTNSYAHQSKLEFLIFNFCTFNFYLLRAQRQPWLS